MKRTGPVVEPLIRNDKKYGWSVLCRRRGCGGFWRDAPDEAGCERLWAEHLEACAGEDRYA
jgi:hypothetical protein